MSYEFFFFSSEMPPTRKIQKFIKHPQFGYGFHESRPNEANREKPPKRPMSAPAKMDETLTGEIHPLAYNT